MPPRAYISHRTEGRLRLRVPDRRRDVAFFDGLRKGLAACPGIGKIDVNPLTTGVLITHFCPVEKLTGFIADQQLLQLDAVPGLPERRGFLNPGEDIMRMLPPALVVLGATQVVRGNVLGPAAGLFWMAMGMPGINPPKSGPAGKNNSA